MSGGLSDFLSGGFAGGPAMPVGTPSEPAPPSDAAILAATAVPRPDGGMDLVLPAEEAETPPERAMPHNGNLAEVLPESVLNAIAYEVIEGFDVDVESNRETYDVYGRGLKLLALKPGERRDDPFEGASGAVHTLLKEAVVRFASEASGELIPAAGPARCQVNGDATPEKEQLAQQKQDWLNYYLTEGDRGYCDDFDKMLVQLGLYGTMFRRVRRDPLSGGKPVSRFLSPFDLVTSAATTDLNGTDRATHVEPASESELIELQLKDWYRNVALGTPSEDAIDWKPAAPGASRTPSDRPEDVEHVLLHQYVQLDLAGFEHVDDDGQPTGLRLPYVVTVDRETQTVLRLVRDWAEDDKEFARQQTFVGYWYMPGLDFLGWGLIHLVGATTDELSQLRQQAANAFTLASFPGGFRLKGGAKSDSSDVTVGPCEFVEIDTGGLPIQQAIMPLTYRDVPPSFAEVMEDVSSTGQRLASIGDAAVGDGREDSLPGTVIALINQATKLQSSVIKRCHRSQRIELRLLADLFGQDPDAEYPYTINGVAGKAVASDFADNADVVPVCDPNVPTQTHRLTMAQGIYTMAQSSGGMLDVRQAATDFLRALGKSESDIARLMPSPPQGTPADVVTEFAMVMKGMPLAVGPAQNHAAHIQAHMAQMTAPGVEKSPAAPALVAHMADHLAAFYRLEAMKLTGMQLAPGQPLPPELDDKVALAVAAASDQMRASLAQVMPPTDGAGAAASAAAMQMHQQELQVKVLEIQMKDQDSQRKAEASARAEEGEFLRQQLTLQNDKQTRVVELLTGLMDLEAARVQAGSDMTTSSLDTLSNQATQTAAVLAAQHSATGEAHKAVGEHHKAVAAMHGATMDAHASGAQSQADVITAMAEQQIAADEREAAASQATTAAAQKEND